MGASRRFEELNCRHIQVPRGPSRYEHLGPECEVVICSFSVPQLIHVFAGGHVTLCAIGLVCPIHKQHTVVAVLAAVTVTRTWCPHMVASKANKHSEVVYDKYVRCWEVIFFLTSQFLSFYLFIGRHLFRCPNSCASNIDFLLVENNLIGYMEKGTCPGAEKGTCPVTEREHVLGMKREHVLVLKRERLCVSRERVWVD